jgi:hypothetical protein
MRRRRPAATLHRRRSSPGREFPNAYLSPLGTPGRIFVSVKIWLIRQAFRHQGATSFAPGSGVVLPRLVLLIFTGAPAVAFAPAARRSLWVKPEQRTRVSPHDLINNLFTNWRERVIEAVRQLSEALPRSSRGPQGKVGAK